MARSRNIKPGFFANEDLVELPFATRLLFIGLWTLADREGRLEDRPKRIKIAVFPADDIDVDAALNALQAAGFIARYQANGVAYIQVIEFAKHQNPHRDERQSEIPAPTAEDIARCKHGASTVQAPCNSSATTGATQRNDGSNTVAIGLIPDSLLLIPDSLNLIPDSSTTPRRPRTVDEREGFERFWIAYPRKVGKTSAFKAWQKINPDSALVDTILAAVDAHKLGEQWLKDDGQFIPHPSTWLNGQRWTDEVTPYVARPVVRRESDLDRSRREAYEKLTGKHRNATDDGDYIDV